MPSNKCSVLGCESERMVKKHVFPLIAVEYDLWVLRTGNKKLEGLSKSYVRKTFLVCCNHFSSSCYSTGTKRLKRGSMPTLLLPSMYIICIIINNLIRVYVYCITLLLMFISQVSERYFTFVEIIINK